MARSHQPHGAQNHDQRPIARAAHAQWHVAARQRQAAKTAQRIGEITPAHAQNNQIASAEAERFQPLRKALSRPAHRHQRHAEALMQAQLRRRPVDQHGIGRDDRLDGRHFVARLLCWNGHAVGWRRQARAFDERLQICRCAFQDQPVVLAQQLLVRVANAFVLAANERDDSHVRAREFVQGGDRLTHKRRALVGLRLQRVAMLAVSGLHRIAAGLAVLDAKHAVGERQQNEPRQRQRQAHRREVKHFERLARHILPDFRDDDVWRCADKRHKPAQQRGEGHRHQHARQGRTMLAAQARGHRHQHGKRANVFHDRGQRRHDQRERAHL